MAPKKEKSEKSAKGGDEKKSSKSSKEPKGKSSSKEKTEKTPAKKESSSKEKPAKKEEPAKPSEAAAAELAPAAPAASAAPAPAAAAAPPPNTCESCGKTLSVEYCMDCDRLYCGECTHTAHASADSAAHRRGPVAEAALLRRRCAEHPGQTLRFYCESCRVPCCAECRAVGAHQGLAHVCQGLAEAFRTKRAELQHLVDGVLHARRDALAAQMRRVEERVVAVRASRAAVERETRAEYEGILDRLGAIEARKLAVLQGDLAALQMDLEACNALEQRIAHVATDAPQMLAQFDDAVAACERAAAKPIHAGSDVRADDFPRETVQRQQQLASTAAAARLLRFKDMAIEMLQEEATEAYTSLRSSQGVQRAESDELNQWIALSERLTAALKKFDRACHFCGVLLSDSSVNTQCRRNHRVPGGAQTVGALSSVQPPQDMFGTGRHFFVSVEKARVSFA